MKESTRTYAQEAYEIILHAAKTIGSRLPGSKGEKAFSDYMGEKLRSIGIEPKTEEFFVAPRSAIGGIPYAGYAGLILSICTFIALQVTSLWFGMAFFGFLTAFWLITCCLLYQRWSDMFFPQKISQNTYGELLPPDGKFDYTIILSGHLDTCWCWKHSAKAYKYKDKPGMGMLVTVLKMVFGTIAFVFLVLTSIFMAVVYAGDLFKADFAAAILSAAWFERFRIALHFTPFVTAIASCFVIMWNDSHEENASRGAMDNASGCALSFELTKYFAEHPDKMPKNCRIVDLNIGSEETGLRGSMAFTEEHNNDDLSKNIWHINIDSIADEDHFNVIVKDDWQNCRFDKDLEEMFLAAFKELGMKSKEGGSMHNPVGGCDSTPMTRAGAKSVTFAAQNPTLTYYYHTWHDVPERFQMETVGDGFDVVLNVIEQIGAYQEKNGYPGYRKK